MSDDQRYDMVTADFMPHLWNLQHGADPRFPNSRSTVFTNAFVPDPLCCPSRASTLSGDFSSTTGVWTDHAPYGGFYAFNDKHTIAGDFGSADYRTAMIGKYLNEYEPGHTKYVPPGWDKWFAARTGDYYNYDITTKSFNGEARYVHFGSRRRDYSTRVFTEQAKTFVRNSVGANQPFFLYLAYTAPHGPAIPDARDAGRFASVTPDVTGTPYVRQDMLESALGIDRSIDKLLNVLPANTIVLYLSDNGYVWGESKGDWGAVSGKVWPYNESLRVPMSVTSLNGAYTPRAQPNDIVLNVDIRRTLTHAAGLSPSTRTEGLDWNGSRYTARASFPIGYGPAHINARVPMYCGARETDWLYVRFQDPDGSHSEELYREPDERSNLVASSDQATIDALDRLRADAKQDCIPGPPGYSW